MPLVTVIVPTHNRADLLPRALASIRSQTFRDLACVVVDDGSSDTTPEWLATVTDPWLTVVRRDVGGGGAAARNAGIAVAAGRYLAFLDDDDEWLPDYLERQLAALTSTGAALSHAGVWIDRDGTRTAAVADTTGDAFERLLCYAAPITTSGILIDRDVTGDVCFDESLPANQEYDLVTRIARAHPITRVTDPLYVWHWHDGDRIVTSGSNAPARRMLIDKYADELATRPKVAAYVWYRLAVAERAAGDVRAQREALATAARIAPGTSRYRVLASAAALGSGPLKAAWRLAPRITPEPDPSSPT